jgi:hypothetical protein
MQAFDGELHDETGQYPSDEAVQWIRDYDDFQHYGALMVFLKSVWWMPAWGWRETRRRYYLSTGGWSGNEELIDALKTSNCFFWSLRWLSSRRGGHYVFEKKRVA